MSKRRIPSKVLFAVKTNRTTDHEMQNRSGSLQLSRTDVKEFYSR